MGRMGLSSLTEVADLGVTIAGQILDCRPYHFRWLFSGFGTRPCRASAATLRRAGGGAANALWRRCGVPDQHRKTVSPRGLQALRSPTPRSTI